MANWISRINLIWTFLLLFGIHGFLYYSLGTPGWFGVTLMASAVDTCIVAAFQFVFRRRARGD